ncbi:zinc-dependent alcohol dehydrogenase family protein [Microterricola viridarii]|uniref:NADPH:quinone reductase n=1 Tax=Microterricola viridarii TaxID=412690 RepID=A0A1H1V6K6_9MICO|nr:zinc-dependent alcohol dehydrogenase family protein [Microterricola viridarii]SDS80250.1 NADPH:quinone reductase [Microterricola viridarii]
MPSIVQCHEFGGPEVLRVVECADAPLGPGEVRYDVGAFALNRADLMFLRGEHYTIPSFPSRIGQEAAGVVTELGEGVTAFQLGDRVTALPFFTSTHGVQGTSAVTPAEYLTRVPAALDLEQGTAIWMQYLTSWFAFVEVARLRPDDTVLITAAASSAGLGALQIARLLGVRAIATVRSAAKADLVRAQGADAVVVTGRDDLSAAVRDVSGGAGIAASFDPIGGRSLFDYADLLAEGATVLAYGTLSDEQPSVPVAAMVRANAVFHPYSMFNHMREPGQRARAVAAISAALETGRLAPIIDRVFDFHELIDAYRYMESNAQNGKIVVRGESLHATQG